jgi:hypothetical protein
MNQYPPQYPQQNPYAAPQAQMMPASGYGQSPMGARMEGQTLVAANGSTFPPVCVKCGTVQGIEWRNQKFVFTPFWAWYFMGWIGYLIFTKRSRFAIPVCQPCHSQWKKWNLFLGLSFVPLILFWVIGFAVAAAVDDGAGIAGIMFTVGILAFIAFFIVAIILRNKKAVSARRIDATYSWLVGVHPTALQAIMTGAMPQPAYPQQPMSQGYPQQQQQQGYPQQGYPQQGGGYGYPQQ